MRKKIMTLVLAVTLAFVMNLTGSVLVSPARAGDYPDHDIEALCPLAAGGAFDLYLRLISNILPKYLGQPLIVINKPGGGGTTVVADMFTSKPDGYKIGFLDSAYFATAVKTQKVPFDPDNAVVPLATCLDLKLGLKVKGDAPWKTLQELLDYAKDNPGKVKWGHIGRGFPNYMNTRIIFEKAGVKTVDIPYKGGPDAINALLGGHIDAITMPHGAVKGLVDSGNIRYLVTFSNERYKDLPDVPCATELGFPEAAKLTPIIGLWVHKDTPEEIKATLTAAIKKAFEDPALKEGIERIGDNPRFGWPDLMMETIRSQSEISVPILKDLGIYVGN